MSEHPDCIFCKIISGKINSQKLFEDENFICIRDIQPQARIHLLVVPKKHIGSLDEAFPQTGSPQVDLIGKMFEVAVKVARDKHLLPGGFRSVINTNRDSGQTVFHLHLHLLGGDSLTNSFA